MYKLMCLATLLLVCAIGCAKKDDGAAPAAKGGEPTAAPAALNPGDEFAFKGSKDDLKAAREQLAKGEDPSTSCTAAKAYADQLAGKKIPGLEDHVKELLALCEHDAPLALAEKEVVKAEEARKKDATGVLSECFNATFDTAMEILKKSSPTDEKVKALDARFLAACPKK